MRRRRGKTRKRRKISRSGRNMPQTTERYICPHLPHPNAFHH